MSLMKPFIKPGACVWVLPRSRIRSGEGPARATVAEIRDGTFRAAGNRGWYGPRETFEHEPEAVCAWHELATSEYHTERARYNKIVNKLMAWQNKAATA